MKRPDPVPWWKRFVLWELLLGLMVTLKHQFRPHNTIEYPKERMPLQPRFRGVPRLRSHPENGDELCIGCLQCEIICPDRCIKIEVESHPSGKGKRAKSFVIDYERCCLCGLCVDPCPTKPITAIYMSHDYELAHYSREEFHTPMDRLYTGQEKVEYRR